MLETKREEKKGNLKIEAVLTWRIAEIYLSLFGPLRTKVSYLPLRYIICAQSGQFVFLDHHHNKSTRIAEKLMQDIKINSVYKNCLTIYLSHEIFEIHIYL